MTQRIFAAALTVFAASILASTARADWNYAKWGMTPKEVVAASNGDADDDLTRKHLGWKKDTENLKILLSAFQQVGRLVFIVKFFFHVNGNKLAMVTLEPYEIYDQRAAKDIELELRTKYGAPATSKPVKTYPMSLLT